ncbi:MAG: ribokinase [Pseudomonadota bacterium]|nr:ribokinase [Pseudomonadota bacterium]
MSASIVVVGSLNMDLVMRMQRAPAGGETLTGRAFAMLPGGKGANQAVACARMGATVAMVGCVGSDANGDALQTSLAADSVDASGVRRIDTVATGVAMIWVEDDGQNRIVLAPGANGSMQPADVERAGASIDASRMLIVQLEVPMPVVMAAIERARRAGVTVMMNAAPAAALPDSLWRQIDYLVVNESEASLLSHSDVVDVAAAWRAGQAMQARGPAHVLVTLGSRGVVVIDGNGSRHATAHRVEAVDTTAAGDTFIGALAVGICQGLALDAAVALGQAAGALCVTRTGAQASIPYRRELAS